MTEIQKGKLEPLHHPVEPIPLRGFGTLHGDLNQILSRNRARQAEMAKVKLATLRSDSDKT